MAEKETYYFSHDYNARKDPKMMRLAKKYSTDGIGIYWCLIEMLYEQGGYIPLIDIESIAYDLHSECERITSVLRDFDLFKFEGESFYSESVLRRIQIRKCKSEKARQSAIDRWSNANAMRTHSEGNAIKGNKKKGKEKKEIQEISLFWDSYHQITGLKKSDLEAAKKHWIKLTPSEQQKAIENIKPYYDSLSDKKYCKKARTYLSDKNFNDEFVKVPEPVKPQIVDEGWGIRTMPYE